MESADKLVIRLRKLCVNLPGSEEYVMVHHPAFRVGKKPYVIAGMNEGKGQTTVSINLGKDAQSGLLGDTRFEKTPYIGQHGWVTVAVKSLAKGELETLVKESWLRVSGPRLRAQLKA